MQKKGISWSKALLIILFLNFFILEVFIGFVTLKTFAVAAAIAMMPDFTPLITLIGAVIGQTISYGIYVAKSKAENTEGGVIYETTLRELDSQLNTNNDTQEDYKDGYV